MAPCAIDGQKWRKALDAQLGARDGAAGELARDRAELETRSRRDRAELAAGDGLADGEAPPG